MTEKLEAELFVGETVSLNMWELRGSRYGETRRKRTSGIEGTI